MSQIMTERFYVAAGGHGWGKGLNADEAKREARKHCARGTRLTVWQLPKGAHSVYVTELGDIRWQWQQGADQSGEALCVERKGKPCDYVVKVVPAPNVVLTDDDDEDIADWKEHVKRSRQQASATKERASK
jgi:hypothetical protein